MNLKGAGEDTVLPITRCLRDGEKEKVRIQEVIQLVK